MIPILEFFIFKSYNNNLINEYGTKVVLRELHRNEYMCDLQRLIWRAVKETLRLEDSKDFKYFVFLDGGDTVWIYQQKECAV